MRAAPFAAALAAFGLVGMLGPGQGAAGQPAPMPVVERGDRTLPIFTAASRPASDWLPASDGTSRPWDGERVLTVEQWRALQAFPAHEQETAARVMFCESGGDASKRIVDTNGEWSVGAWQVQPRWHGDVPRDLSGQAIQVAAIVARHGWGPWSCH